MNVIQDLTFSFWLKANEAIIHNLFSQNQKACTPQIHKHAISNLLCNTGKK